MSCNCRWGDSSSSYYFDIPSGTKQGGILSPDYFSLYVNDLITMLKKSGLGCHVISKCIACIFFADDMALLSPTSHGLQSLLNICVEYCRKFCLDFNVKKSKIMVFGKTLKEVTFSPLHIHNCRLDYVSQLRYLGVTLAAGDSFSFSAESDLRSFYRAINSILCRSNGPSEQILMKLLYTNCIPILTYACASKEFSSSEMSACNSAIGRIFSFSRTESIRQLRELFGYKSLYEIFNTAKDRFSKATSSSSNCVIKHLANCF